jgi:hypothetical protein
MEQDHDRIFHGRALGILKGKRHILFVAVVSMIIALVILDVVFANSIYKAGRFSLKNPLSYVMIDGFLLLLGLKLKYLWGLVGFKNSIRKHFKK